MIFSYGIVKIKDKTIKRFHPSVTREVDSHFWSYIVQERFEKTLEDVFE